MKNQNTIGLIILGFGKIGQALVKQILAASNRQKSNGGDFRVIGLADSKALLYNDKGFSPSQVDSAITHKRQNRSLQEIDSALPLDTIEALVKPNTILIDTSASSDTLPLLQHAMDSEAGIVLANKLPLCQPLMDVQKLFSYPHLRYEATVGAGLPVISTLKYLLDTGDRLDSIVGCLSGTLGYLCSRLEAGVSYSQAIKDAHALGYTEPDPRQDLGGMDVARKAIILSRTAGITSELSGVSVESLYDKELEEVSIEEFLSRTSQSNNHYADLVRQAAAEQKTPRYTAHVAPEGITVGLTLVNKSSSIGSLKGTENYIAIRTLRYSASPLVISGPGAGIEVTAAGVFGDIIQLGKEIVGRC